jgi:hypothetical protein
MIVSGFRAWLAIILVILGSFDGFAQVDKQDSLLLVWQDKTELDTNRLDAAFRLAKTLRKSDPDSAQTLLENQYQFAKQIGDKEHQAQVDYYRGTLLWNKNQEKAIQYLNRAKDEFNSIGKMKQVSNCLIFLGAI